MDSPRLVALLLPYAWLAWAASTTILAVQSGCRDVIPRTSQRRLLWITSALALASFAATFVIPARIDSSGLLELAAGHEPWKGASGEGLLQLVGYVVTLDLHGIVVFTRACVVPASMLAALVIAGQKDDERTWLRGGIDLRSAIGVSTLLVTPSYLFGLLGVFNFWFFCMVALAMMLAWQQLERAPTAAGRLALVASVLLIGFARPETIAGGVVLAVIVTAFGWRRRDFWLLVPGVLALALLLYAAPSVTGYLAERMRNQPLLTGSDATGTAPLWQLPWIAARRILEHAPINLVMLLVALHALGVFAVARAVHMVRTRGADWMEIAAVGLIVSEFLAIGIHREGFTRYIKYGQLLVVPCWYLAMRAWYARPVDPRLQKLLKGAVAAGVVAMTASLVITVPGFNRCSMPGASGFSARRADEELLWITTPRWTRSVCRRSDPQTSRVLVVGFDERLPRGKSGRVEDPFSKPSCEPERWPIEQLLARGGCSALSAYPDMFEPTDKALFDPNSGLLCRALPFAGQDPQRPTHAIVSYYYPETIEELRAALEAHPSCPWEIVETTRSAILLRAR